ncbi:MAG: hypothetical protein OXI73_13750, partial [Rhodospirillales bacterium]|nr:hypothetical protein [Rhodospirillales bacterium]
LHSNMTVLTRDIYQRFVAPRRSQAHYVTFGRGVVLVLLAVGYVLSVSTFDFLVTLITLSGTGALQLMPAILGVCYPGRRSTTRAGVLAGIITGLITLYVTRVMVYQPLGIHEAIWSLAVNFAVTIIVSRVSTPPSDETRARIHGEIERFVYGE